jgi:hypothetical protein
MATFFKKGGGKIRSKIKTFRVSPQLLFIGGFTHDRCKLGSIVQYPAKKSERDFFQTATYQYYGELCLAFSPNWGGGARRKAKGGKKQKGIISHWACLLPPPSKKYMNEQTGCLKFSWREKLIQPT